MLIYPNLLQALKDNIHITTQYLSVADKRFCFQVRPSLWLCRCCEKRSHNKANAPVLVAWLQFHYGTQARHILPFVFLRLEHNTDCL